MIAVYGRDFDEINFSEIARQSHSLQEFARNLGFNYSNAKLTKAIKNAAEIINLSLDHFDSNFAVKSRIKYPRIIKICPVCGIEFETQQGHPKEKTTCSYICSNTFFLDKRQTEDAKLKRSNSLISFHELNGSHRIIHNINCYICNILFQSLYKERLYCSISCAAKAKWRDEDYRNGVIARQRERIDNGEHKGWSSRLKLIPSYPEQYFISLFEELGITNFIRELKVGRWFIDFAFQDKMLALEVDGKQHELLERKISDTKKDYFLEENGWTVIRIKWKRPSKENREELIKFLNDLLL